MPRPRCPVRLPWQRGRVERRVPMTRLRARIAERLVTAQSTQALLTTFNEVDLLAVQELRARHKDKFEKNHGVKLGFSSFFVTRDRRGAEALPGRQCRGGRQRHRLSRVLRHRRGGLDRPRPGGAGAARCGYAELCPDREGGRRFRRTRPQRHADHGRSHGRHVQHHQRRRVRLAAVDADRQCAAERHPRHAQDPGASGGRGRPDRRSAR